MKSFASDNYSGVCVEVLKAIEQANQAHVASYGKDIYTQKALDLLRQNFSESSKAYFVYNGTAANTLALKAVTRSHHSIICADSAHIATQEVRAVTAFSGCPLITVPNQQGKLTPLLVEQAYLNATYWGIHNNLPKVVSIIQPTEFGTVYTLEELTAIAAICQKYGLLLHMDGCRLANAAVHLDVSLRALTYDVGVNIVSFGGAKNGLLVGEVIIFVQPELASEFEYIQKQGLQLHSKMRFLAAQFIPYLENYIWQRNARHANKMCERLAQGLAQRPDIEFAYPVQSNQIFAYFSQKVVAATQSVFPYYIWNKVNDDKNLVRLVTGFDTTEEEVDEFIQLAVSAS